MAELIYKDEVYAIVGAAMEVHRVLGSGFLEAVYHEGMEIECLMKQIPFVSQEIIQIKYKEHILKKEYVADMICFEKIIVEFKALDQLTAGRSPRLLII
jgi:GxxExxY protein